MSYLDLTLTVAPSTPSTNHVEIYGDSSDGLLKYINSSGTISVISLPQSLSTSASPTFSNETLTATTNQLVLGTTRTTTISATQPATSSRTVTIPDPGANDTFTLLGLAQTITSIKTFNAGAGAITMSSSTIAMGANKITGLANGTVSTDAAAFGQIPTIYNGFQAPVQATTTSQTATTSSSFANTNLTASITPTSSSHRIRITITATIQVNTATTIGHVTIKRGSTDLSTGTGFAIIRNGSVATQAGAGTVSISYIDSPATTTSTTYTMAIRNEDSTSTVADCIAGATEIIILEEIV